MSPVFQHSLEKKGRGEGGEGGRFANQYRTKEAFLKISGREKESLPKIRIKVRLFIQQSHPFRCRAETRAEGNDRIASVRHSTLSMTFSLSVVGHSVGPPAPAVGSRPVFPPSLNRRSVGVSYTILSARLAPVNGPCCTILFFSDGVLARGELRTYCTHRGVFFTSPISASYGD